MDQLSFLELKKLDPTDQPEHIDNYELLLSHPMRNLTIYRNPETWSYWDDEIPKWYEIWEDSTTARLKSDGRQRTPFSRTQRTGIDLC